MSQVPQFKKTLLALSLLSLTGCVDHRLHGYITQFNDVVQKSTLTVKLFYNNANDAYRDLYLTEARLSPGMEIKVTEKDSTGKIHNTGLVQYYSDDYIQARILAIDALASYTEELAVLATCTAPEQAEQSILATGDKLGKLGDQLQALDPKHQSAEIQQFSTPISQLLALTTKALLNEIRNKEVGNSLNKSQSTVDGLCLLLTEDLNEITTISKGDRAAKILALYKLEYNDTPALLNGSPTDGMRNDFINDIGGAAKKLADISSENPAKLIVKIQKIHNDIIAYLNRKKSSKHQLEIGLVDDLNEFDADANALYNVMTSGKITMPPSLLK